MYRRVSFLPASDVFRVLADPTRRGLFERLAEEGELSVAELTRGYSRAAPPGRITLCVSGHHRARG